ncbi:hypothetical protein FHS78_003465, partial [Parvibaculum indicum]|nr:hypothetical protein [Parvibaculum indicum]
VERLNRFQAALLTPYASMAALLADEQEAGLLHIHPVLLALSAEGLPQKEYGRIARVFNAKVGNSYAASECMFLSYMCSEGNAGIVVSGAAVMLFGSPLPDLIIGLVVGGIVIKGGWDILEEAREAPREGLPSRKD